MGVTDRPNRGRASALPAARSLVLAAGAVFFAIPAAGQDPSGDEEPGDRPRPTTIFDFLETRIEDPADLFPPQRDFQNRWRRIWGALGMRYHLYPSQQTGPDNWPPHPYAGGMNYSIWRNPVTGWPEF